MRSFLLKAGIDRAVFFTVLGRSWNVVAGLLTIAAVTYFLSPELQGYYYTFNSLIALQIFAELGLSFAIIQFASHEMVHLSWMSDRRVDGDSQAKRRLQSLLKFALYWFGITAILMITILLPTGMFFFRSAELNVISFSNVAIPWSLLVVCTSLNLFVVAAAALLEGCGKVSHVAAFRFWQSLVATFFIVLTLGFGGQLYALTVSSLMMALVGVIWLRIHYWNFFKDLFKYRSSNPGLNWKNEIWPFQWRIAVSWVSGYLIFQLYTPILFKTHGPVAAGQMGMSLQIINAMNAVAIAWISTKVPVFSQFIANRQRQLLDQLFFRSLIQSFIFLLIIVVCVWLIFMFFNTISSPYAQRVIPLHLFTFLCMVCLANHVVFAEASYLRAHKVEPLIYVSIFSAVVNFILAFLTVPSAGLAGAVFSYVTVAIAVSLIGSTFIFIFKRRQWAQAEQAV